MTALDRLAGVTRLVGATRLAGAARSAAPRIDYRTDPRRADTLVLLAHGGQEHSTRPVPQRWPPVLRMLPFAEVAAHAAPGVAVGLVRYRLQGWNGTGRDAALDLRSVLERLPAHLERVLLVGHSMGGRAVVQAGAVPRVAGVCALNPWLPAGEPLGDLSGRLLVFAHGTRDDTTDFRGTAEVVRHCREHGWPAAFLSIAGGRHNMLDHPRVWDDVVRRFVRAGTGHRDGFLDAALSADPAHPPTMLPTAQDPRVWRGAAAVAAATLRWEVSGRHTGR